MASRTQRKGILCGTGSLTLFLIAASVSVPAQSQAVTDVSPQLERLLAAQGKLPPESVAALQDLRLVAAVQAAYFSEKGYYQTPRLLQEEDYLDPKWPRADSDAYRVTCELKHEAAAFVCHADARRPKLQWYMVDSTLAVRWAAQKRPTARSPVFGSGKEQ